MKSLCYRVEKVLDDLTLVGYIDILDVNSVLKTVFEVKSGKEKDSHHVQLWIYMGCFDGARGILKYLDTRYHTEIKIYLKISGNWIKD